MNVHRKFRTSIGAVVVLGVVTACGPSDAPLDYSQTSLSGHLGELGDVKRMVSSLMISNSGETLVYMSSEPLTCAGLTISRWLGQVPPDAQVVEIVIKGDPSATTYEVPPGEVNYAKGGRSSAYEVAADSGEITFVTAQPGELVEGEIDAHYGDDELKGSFHATFCDGGQGY